MPSLMRCSTTFHIEKEKFIIYILRFPLEKISFIVFIMECIKK